RVIEQILAVLEVPSGTTDAKDETIGYILDSRAAGRRILATLEAFISHGIIGDAAELSGWPGLASSPSPSDPRNDTAGTRPPRSTTATAPATRRPSTPS